MTLAPGPGDSFSVCLDPVGRLVVGDGGGWTLVAAYNDNNTIINV